MDLIIATNNNGKLKEFREILKDKFDNIYGLAEKNINIEIEETGKTFQENALIKAKTIAIIRFMVTPASATRISPTLLFL